MRQESDVDICILYTGAYYPDYSQSVELTSAMLGHKDGTYPYATFKNDVEAALVAFFERAGVTRGNKAFDVHANTYRVDADVVPCFEYRRYFGPAASPNVIYGTQLNPDKGSSIINWPRQNYKNGVDKNDATKRGFKGVVRVIKRLRNEMADNKIAAAQPIPSYLIECLIWNTPNETLMNPNWKTDVRDAIAYLWTNTRSDEQCNAWREINQNKYLFRDNQPWTRQSVNDFLQATWNYIGFE